MSQPAHYEQLAVPCDRVPGVIPEGILFQNPDLLCRILVQIGNQFFAESRMALAVPEKVIDNNHLELFWLVYGVYKLVV